MIRLLMNNKLGRIWKETIMAQFEVISQYLPGGLRETTEHFSQDNRSEI
jgi:hypothetical protein